MSKNVNNAGIFSALFISILIITFCAGCSEQSDTSTTTPVPTITAILPVPIETLTQSTLTTQTRIIPLTTQTKTTIGASDPIVGHWGGLIHTVSISIDAYSNGTALWEVTSSSAGSVASHVKWEKNPNGTYTLFTDHPALLTISGDTIVMGGEDYINNNVTLSRGVV